jgi:ankyrin repeat protein
MAAAGQGVVAIIEQLLAFGSDVSLKASNGWTAKDFAVHTAKQAAVDVLQAYQ